MKKRLILACVALLALSLAASAQEDRDGMTLEVGPSLPTHAEMDWQIRQRLDDVSTAELEWIYDAVIDASERHAEAVWFVEAARENGLDSKNPVLLQNDDEPDNLSTVISFERIGNGPGGAACFYIWVHRGQSIDRFEQNCRVGNGYRGGQTCNDLRQIATNARNLYTDLCPY
jgi:hypothetical protein